eukprot:gnl/MRDRNA2_/MRDRNA2_84446_c0_seq1.p1 gnl/MRDRNA2_/MRDRNA2_84446_c0~~gnl/MRDRNA2_/MRDRNA2_84446_c0_seq1.p1  ORF type:complete len:100 (-),score=8.23 gnl/MRDRNA2_/MRDRNA2_84446_c0_seq1:82-381(-)
MAALTKQLESGLRAAFQSSSVALLVERAGLVTVTCSNRRAGCFVVCCLGRGCVDPSLVTGCLERIRISFSADVQRWTVLGEHGRDVGASARFNMLFMYF